MEGLGLDIKLILAQIINFAILLWLLNRLLYKPIINFLETRRAKIEEGLKKSAEIEVRLAQIEEDRSTQLREVTVEAQGLIKKAEGLAKEAEVKILAEARQQAAAQIKEAAEQIKARENQMFREVQKEMVELAGQAAEKILEEELSEKKHHALVTRLLAQLKESDLNRKGS